jgi:glucans biosynthesis protein
VEFLTRSGVDIPKPHYAAHKAPFMQRRELLKAAGALALAGFPLAVPFGALAARTHLRPLGKPQDFDYAWLKGRARYLAGRNYESVTHPIPEKVARLDWDQYQAIRYRADHALWAEERTRFRIRFFHLGLFFKKPVQMYEVVAGKAQELAYDPAMFDYGKSGLDGGSLPQDLGFAGFQVFHNDPKRDVAAFLGASYFRAVGKEMQYGQSARGLAVDCGLGRPEEFPEFTDFWFEQPAASSNTLTVYALLNSPSITGAYRFDIRPAATLVIDVDAALYPRKPVERLGIAPLTSMFQYGENDRRASDDWRPEIHDSDGLSMWTGSGEWIWRALANPGQLHFNAFQDENPRGFGLLQRDRSFDHYQDDGAFYDRRPGVWVEPRSGWGKGSVQLVELPTADETFDNIVAFWNPAAKPKAGDELLYSYRLHWGSGMPASSPLAKVVATRTGAGGIVGQKRKHYSRRFVVDFAGGDLARLGRDAKVEPVITASRGEVEITSARPLEAVRGYRAMFDLKPADASVAPIDLRLYLRAGGRPLTETWLYQWVPPPADQRRFGSYPPHMARAPKRESSGLQSGPASAATLVSASAMTQLGAATITAPPDSHGRCVRGSNMQPIGWARRPVCFIRGSEVAIAPQRSSATATSPSSRRKWTG